MKGNVTYRILSTAAVAFLAILFFAPHIQRRFNLFEQAPLKGLHGAAPQPKWSWKAWFDGTLQQKFDAYASDSFGLTPVLVKTINQLEYNIFNTANARYVTVGQQNFLYETAYIEAELGTDFIGMEKIEVESTKLGVIAAALKKKNVRFLVVLAPGKGSFFPEYFPKYAGQFRRSTTNYLSYKNALNLHNIDVLDLHSWFREMKDTSRYHLFPQTGIHWSTYGMALAGDSIMKYLAGITGKDLVKYEIKPGRLTKKVEQSDADVEDGMNLWWPLERLPMMYPDLSFQPGKDKIRTSVIADSYFWGLYDHGFISRTSDSSAFWYYFQEVYPGGRSMSSVNLRDALEKQDVVILLATDATLPRLGWGFIDAAYELYK